MIIFDWILRNPYSDVQCTWHVQFCVHSQYACDKSDIKFVPIKWFVKYLNARTYCILKWKINIIRYIFYVFINHDTSLFTLHYSMIVTLGPLSLSEHPCQTNAWRKYIMHPSFEPPSGTSTTYLSRTQKQIPLLMSQIYHFLFQWTDTYQQISEIRVFRCFCHKKW